MIRSLTILLLSCLPLRAASPLFYAPTTNQLKAIVIPPLSARLATFSSGSGLTNGFDGAFWLFDATSTWAANGTNIIAPTTGTGKWHISQSILRRNNFYTNGSDNIIMSTMVGQSQPMFYITSAGAQLWGPGSGAVDTSLQRNVANVLTASGSLSAPNGFRTTTMTALRFLESNGTDFVSADLFDTANTWTDSQVFSQGSGADPGIKMMVNGDSQQRFDIFMTGQLNWGSGSAVTDTALGRGGAGTLVIATNLVVTGLTAGRVVASGSSGLLVSLPAPAFDGYVLSSTVAGVQSWIPPGGGGSANLNRTYSKASETTIANTTATTTFLFAAEVGSTNIAMNTLAAGAQIRLKMGGYYTTKVLTPGNFSISFYLAGQTESITLSGFPANVSSTVGVWQAEYNWSVMTIGSSGTVAGQGSFTYTNPLVTDAIFGGGAKRSSTVIDTTADIGINVAGTWATADANNSITCEYVTIELMNN